MLPFDYLSNQKQQDSVNDIISLLEVIDTENTDIDHVLSKVNNIYIKAASNTMIFKTRGSQEPVSIAHLDITRTVSDLTE